jgi:hypothetical protein
VSLSTLSGTSGGKFANRTLLSPIPTISTQAKIPHQSYDEIPAVPSSSVVLSAFSHWLQILCKLFDVVHPLVSSLFRPPRVGAIRITIHGCETRLSSDSSGKK